MRIAILERWLIAGLCLAGAGSTFADDDHLVYVARKGDTLIGLGKRLLADPQRWHEIQRLNRIEEPRRIPPARLGTQRPLTFSTG